MGRATRSKTMIELNLKTAINAIDGAALVADQGRALGAVEHATLLMAALNRLSFLEDKCLELATETFDLKRMIPSGEQIEVVSLVNALNCKQGFMAERDLRAASFKSHLPMSRIQAQPDDASIL